jgi:hypothetical protein
VARRRKESKMIDPQADNITPPAAPPVELTLEQQAAAAGIELFIKDTGRRLLVLHGATGTGKTTVLEHIASRHRDAVFERSCKTTAHLHNQFSVLARDKALLLLDEASFMDVELREQLMRNGVRIVAAVDPGHLPLMHGDPGFPRADFQLGDIHPRALCNPISRQAHAVLTGLDYAPDTDAFQVMARGTPELLCEADIVLCWCNRHQRALNQFCRQARGVVPKSARRDGGFDPSTDFPTYQDLVIVRENGPRHGIWPGAVGWLDDDLRSGDTEVSLFQLSESWGSCGAYQFPLSRFEGMPRPSLTPDGLALDFAFCLTVPDAMGGKWSNVVLLDDCPLDDPQRSAWLYSAFCAAETSVTVIRKHTD